LKRIAFTAGAAFVLLTACSQSTSHTAAPASRTGTHIAPVSCGQRYQAWKEGQGKEILAKLKAVSTAGTVGNTKVLMDALENAKPAVARAADHPIPACADPQGYWTVLLMHVNAAAASRGTPSSVRAAMQDVPMIERQLTTEVKPTTR
jgi:ABC-type Fe3+ transport system substrate-binding protein